MNSDRKEIEVSNERPRRDTPGTLTLFVGLALTAALAAPAGASALNNGDPCSPYWTQASPPVAAFTSSAPPIYTGGLVNFNASSSTSGTAHKWTYVSGDAACESTSTESDPISNYHFDFGDGTSVNGASIADHSYAHAGTYTVTLTVTEQNCQGGALAHCFTGSVQHDVTILDQPPVAAFSPPTAIAGEPATFDASGSSDSDGTVAGYHWQFGDGHSQDTTNPTTAHTYAMGGSKLVTLTVTDDSGSTGQVVQVVHVARRCVVPDLTGKRLHRARRLLRDRDCSLGQVKHKKAGKAHRRRVLKQSADPNTVLPVGSPVGVTVGK